MKSLFPSHFASDPNRLSKLWADCIFVFDTNVLTGLYKYSDETRDALYKVIESLGDRLWVPYQVMFEYLDNRAKIVHDQSKLYESAISKLVDLKSEIEIPNRAPFVSKDIYEDFCQSAERVLGDLKNRRDLHSSRITDDEVKQRLADLLDGKVGPAYTSETLNALVIEGERRYAQNIPPGFEDRDKHKGSSLVKEINKRYGDLIFWKQVLDKAKDSSSSVILVTGERKEDWWSVCGGKTIGPLPELMEEFASVTGKEFYIYTTHNFLNFANDYLQQDTPPAAVDEVRDAFVNDKEVAAREFVQEEFLLEDISEGGNIESSSPNKFGVSYYRRMEASLSVTLEQLEIVISNIREKVAEAERVSSPAVVQIQRDHLANLLSRRKALRMKRRYCLRKITQILDDDLIGYEG
ncbi:PIN-like domain-containing protein [Pseudomonas pergaminensis]